MAVPTTTLSHRRISYSLLASMAALLLVFHHHIPSTTAQPLPWQLCNDTSGNFTDKSAYQANINQLAAALTRNASSSLSLFATGAVGSAPDVAYALALCRGDTNASSCARCVAASFKTAQQLCAFKRGATLYDDPCILRYADWDFLANTTDNRGLYIAWSYDNISAVSAPAFDASSGRGRILYATSDYAATDPIRRFGTGEEDFDDVTYPKVYTLAQCTPDMTEAECRKCLGGVYATFAPMYFAGKHGGRVFGVRCGFRFETYPFFSGNPLLQIPGPPRNMTPPPPVNMTLTVTGQDKSRNKTTTVLLATLMPSVAAALGITMICFWTRTRSAAQSFQPYSISSDDIQGVDMLLIDLSALRVATDDFAESRMLGKGGFGMVFKGALLDGQEIAVKRLCQTSQQGIGELKSELVLVAKLHHKNLVRLIGVCLQEHEKILVYEYMPNRSLDTILFDSERNKELDWGKRFKIINGIAKGLQYLHEDSQLKVVHRDLKASNVLLDLDYIPKISDFGLAKIFGGDESKYVTSRIAGTYGYMAPEYAMRGLYSIKSDVFSFGVLVLEIVTGRRNGGLYNSDQDVDLLNLVWGHWARGNVIGLMDSSLMSDHPPIEQMLKCVHIGLLCVQRKPAARPLMSQVNIMLCSSSVCLPSLSRPALCIEELSACDSSDAYSEEWQGASESMKNFVVITGKKQQISDGS